MEQGILSGPEIKRCINSGKIVISPYDERFLNPGSYDVRLGRKVAVYKDAVVGGFRPIINEHYDGPQLRGPNRSFLFQNQGPESPMVGEFLAPRPFSSTRPDPISAGDRPRGYLDAKKEAELVTTELEEGEGILLRPGIGYLMHTEERVRTDHFIPVLDGKSSVGRLFVTIHVTAGYGELGFDGQYTLEVMVQHPVVLYAGMRIGQVRFHTVVGDKQSYQESGHYTGSQAEGPVASKAHLQIQEDQNASKK